MINESHTAILERHATLSGDHQTEPYECAWATEAVFFLHPVEPAAVAVRARVEVSADGRRWVDHEVGATLPAGGSGIRIPVSRFGGWLRLALTAEASVRYDLYLVLKE